MIVETAILIAWLVVLARYVPLRDLVRDGPRGPVALVAALLLLSIYVQLRNDRVRFFPVVSWQMYGQVLTEDWVRSFELSGIGCDGRRRRLGDPIPGHSLRIRIQFLGRWHDRARTGADSARRGAVLDSTLSALGEIQNLRNPEDRLCAVELDRFTIGGDQVRSGVIPPSETVRHVALR